ncbi:MAG: hypothetical protein WA705_13940 [Candidatus Ozemobacteraceae bacterium]
MQTRLSLICRRWTWFLILLLLPLPVYPLAVQYNRNGECYLLLGDGAFKGVYRLNNPAGEGGIPIGLLYNNFFTSIGLSVDLNRVVYSFSETVDPGYTVVVGNISRQVLNGTQPGEANWGYHSPYHADYHGGGPIYRPSGKPFSVGPGIPTTAPTSSDIAPPPSDGIYAGKQWYSIPNGAWYQMWKRPRPRTLERSANVYKRCIHASSGDPIAPLSNVSLLSRTNHNCIFNYA